VVSPKRTSGESAKFHLSDYRLVARHSYRVAKRPCGRPALSELGVKVSLHPVQALRTPPERRRGFETGRRRQ
jgi:hypothetical protein